MNVKNYNNTKIKFIMRVSLKLQKSCNPKTYYRFTLVELQLINTFQVWSINATFCNIFLQIFHEKKKYNNKN